MPLPMNLVLAPSRSRLCWTLNGGARVSKRSGSGVQGGKNSSLPENGRRRPSGIATNRAQAQRFGFGFLSVLGYRTSAFDRKAVPGKPTVISVAISCSAESDRKMVHSQHHDLRGLNLREARGQHPGGCAARVVQRLPPRMGPARRLLLLQHAVGGRPAPRPGVGGPATAAPPGR